MSKQILLPTSVITALRKTFKTSNVTLWQALNFKNDSPLARTLREAARQRGGLLYTGVLPDGFIADCETTFDTAGRKITQKFGNGLTIVADQANNTATVTSSFWRRYPHQKNAAISRQLFKMRFP